MKQFFTKILSKISFSVLENDPHSTHRIQSYIVLIPILCMCTIFSAIEIWAFLHTINCGEDYHISNEIILIFGMILSHHLAVLFSRKKSQSIDSLKKDETEPK